MCRNRKPAFNEIDSNCHVLFLIDIFYDLSIRHLTPTLSLFQTDTYMKKMRSSIHLLFRMIQKLETSREGSYLGYERT